MQPITSSSPSGPGGYSQFVPLIRKIQLDFTPESPRVRFRDVILELASERGGKAAKRRALIGHSEQPDR